MIDHASGYRAAYEGLALYDMAACGRIFTRDRDRAALLHRLSTNEIEKLQPGQGNRTVLTSPIGRIIELLTVYNLPDEADPRLLLVTSPGQGGAVLKHLKKNIFFNDKLKVEDASASLGQLALYGPHSTALLAKLSGLALADLALHAVRPAELAGAQGFVARSQPIGGAGWQLFVPSEALPALREALLAAGAVALDEPTYDLLRVEHGYPAYGRELSLDYIPLETDLWDAISFSKGCYVGQEIIARMESRGRLAKVLRGVKLIGDGDLNVPAKLDAAGKEAGDLTSVVTSPLRGRIGLAYVRTAHAEPGTRLGIAGSDLGVEVIKLPFAAA
jgi:tRNA-modifying protein YgfZ